MPLEIRELVVRTNIVSANNERPNQGMSESEREELKKEIVNECTKQVLNQMKKKMNR